MKVGLLPVGTAFRQLATGKAGTVVHLSPCAATVQWTENAKVVELPNGKRFIRREPPVTISLGSEVEPV